MRSPCDGYWWSTTIRRMTLEFSRGVYFSVLRDRLCLGMHTRHIFILLLVLIMNWTNSLKIALNFTPRTAHSPHFCCGAYLATNQFDDSLQYCPNSISWLDSTSILSVADSKMQEMPLYICVFPCCH